MNNSVFSCSDLIVASSFRPFFGDRRERPWLWGGTLGCSGLLCIAILVISIFFVSRQINGDDQLLIDAGDDWAATKSPGTADRRSSEAINTTPTVGVSSSVFTNVVDLPTKSDLVAKHKPEFGSLCFTPTPANDQISECKDIYPPVIEMHVIFDYVGLSTDNEWTRIWYHNGREVLRVAESWTGDVEGQFDYNLNTADGQPLSSGLWQLELYIDGQLEIFGSFVIEAPDEPSETPIGVIQTPTATPIMPIKHYLLAFTKWDGGKHSVWRANLDGSNQQFLLDFAASPSWSPDGQSITFYGEEGIDTQSILETGTNGIWKMGAGGENPVQLLPEGSAHTVAWSPVNNWIAFDAARGGPDRRIYFIDADGTPQSFEILGEQPAWSPDGQSLVAKVCRPACGLWIANRDDSNAYQLTGEGSDGLPAWSPDGTKIAFSRNVNGNVDIFVINIDGSGLHRLTVAPGNDSVPAWTPDGRQIVFRTTRNGIWQIFLMWANGANQRLIIDNVGASDEWAFDRMSVR